MPNALQQAGALSEPSNFAPLHTNRIFTGLWTNRSPLRDAATTDYQEHYGMGRQDSIWDDGTGLSFNTEISARLTLIRRYGTSNYQSTPVPPVRRFYSFNTFTATTELVRVMADTANNVYDVTNDKAPASIFTKSGGAGPTYFLGVGNTLYMTNGVDNVQYLYPSGAVSKWGIAAPTTAPVATQAPRSNPYGSWQASTVYAAWVQRPDVPTVYWNYVVIKGSDGNLYQWGHYALISDAAMNGQLGKAEPVWGTTHVDGTITWTPNGNGVWKASYGYGLGELVVASISGHPDQLFVSITSGQSSSTPPSWASASGIGMQLSDGTGGLIWQNIGPVRTWANIATLASGALLSNYITTGSNIVDSNGYLQTIYQMGTSSTGLPSSGFDKEHYALTADGTQVIWQNTGPYSVPSTAPVTYVYEWMDSKTNDLSNASPRSNAILVIQGNQVTLTGDSCPDPQVDKVVIFRTTQGGSTPFYLATINNPTGGAKWTYIDNSPDSALTLQWQAQMGGEGTPLPAGAGPLGYHVGRIFAGVGNVVWVSSGPDAVVGGSSGNAGFDIFLTCQSKITRFWACSLGMVVFTVRDAYIILGSGTDADPLYMVTFIEDLPLRNYDCFTVNKTTPYLLTGNNTLLALDPSAGIIEIGFPIADRLEAEYDSSTAYVTFHKEASTDTALYVANANGQWYRMAAVNAPENGSAWSPKAIIPNMGCVQSVEILPGQYKLLISGTLTKGASTIRMRDRTQANDLGTPFAAQTVFGSIVLALPGQLAALSFITLESRKVGTQASLALLLGEIRGTFESLKRTRQDPTNLPPSESLYSDRFHFSQNQNTAWCRHFQMMISWPTENAMNELLSFTIFGQTWQEMRAQ